MGAYILFRAFAGNQCNKKQKMAFDNNLFAINVGVTSDIMEIRIFMPGVDKESIDLSIEKNVLTISGKRINYRPQSKDVTIHVNERFAGSFKREIEIPEFWDIENTAEARYSDGILHVRIPRKSREERRIKINVE